MFRIYYYYYYLILPMTDVVESWGTYAPPRPHSASNSLTVCHQRHDLCFNSSSLSITTKIFSQLLIQTERTSVIIHHGDPPSFSPCNFIVKERQTPIFYQPPLNLTEIFHSTQATHSILRTGGTSSIQIASRRLPNTLQTNIHYKLFFEPMSLCSMKYALLYINCEICICS